MRLFIACEIDEKNRHAIYGFQKSIKTFTTKGSFTPENNYHITLKFIGETEQEDLSKIRFSIDRIAEQYKKFSYISGAPGYFKTKDGAVLFLGLGQGAEYLWQIASAIDEEFIKSGFPKEKGAYNPHITLGRRVYFKEDFNIIKQNLTIPELYFNCDSITLMQSCREKGVLFYRPVYKAMLL